MRCSPNGPSNARIVIVGEAPGEREEAEGRPFIGSAGFELENMLKEAKLNKSDCFLTNVCMDRPHGNDIKLWISPKRENKDGTEIKYRGKVVKPHIKDECERLYSEIKAVGPNVVIAAGNTPLWALTPYDKVGKWRGSILESDAIPGLKVIPTYHPAAVLRMYDWRFITVQDYRRAAKESLFPQIKKPQWNFDTGNDYRGTTEVLQRLLRLAEGGNPLVLVSDVEIKRLEILCVGIAWSRNDAICIPFYGPQPDGTFRDGWHYWAPEEHINIVLLLHKLFLHPNVRLVNQNLSFDIQYFFWRMNMWPRAAFDTMLAHHVMFPGLPKKLDFQASMYCDYYVYWKDDGKFWDKPVIYPQLWHYNCLDCVYTYEIMEVQEKALNGLNLRSQFTFQMDRLFPKVMKMMFRGVKVNEAQKSTILKETREFVSALHSEVEYMAGRSLVGDKGSFSSKRLQDFFYKSLGLTPLKNKVQGKMIVTCDDEALKKIRKNEPLLRPLCDRIILIRSYKTAIDAVSKRVDKDGRWRTSYNLAGAHTLRWSSSENIFDSGLNLQNLTIGKDIF